MEQLQAELQDDYISAELDDSSSEDSISLDPPPQELHLKKAEWKQYERSIETPTSLGLPVSIFTGYGSLFAGSLGAGAAILSVNLPFLYGVKKMHDASVKQSEIDSELENWHVFGNDYDISDVLKGAEPLEDRSSDEMLESYEKILEDFRDVDSEIKELTNTDIANEDFYDDCLYAIQAIRIEEDNNFGGYHFQASIYLDGKEIDTYSGHTTDEEVIEKLESDGTNAKKARNGFRKHFDVGKPLGLRLTKPEPL